MLEHRNILVIGDNEMANLHVDLLKRYPQVTVKSTNHYVLEEIDAFILTETTENSIHLLDALMPIGKPIFYLHPDNHPSELLHWQEHSIPLQIGFKRRFDPHFLHVKEKITAGVLGKIHIVKIINRYEKPATTSSVITTHDIDLARFMTNQEIKSVFAMQNTIDQVETVVASLKMMDDSLVMINASCGIENDYDQRLEVFGEQGALLVDNIIKTSTYHYSKRGVQFEKPHTNPLNRYQHAFHLQLQTFLNLLSEPDHAVVPGLPDWAASMQALAAINQSMKTHQLIRNFP